MSDLGGDPPCWAHLLDDGTDPVVADLGSTDTTGARGAVWSLPHGGDLDANLIRLPSGSGIAEHVNDEVDVLVFVQSGSGTLVVDGSEHALWADVVALVPRGAARRVDPGPQGLTYLSVHRRRGPLGPPVRR